MTSKAHEVIDISEKIHDLVYRDCVLIRHPQGIEPRVLEGFLRSKNPEKVILINGEVTASATLVNINHNSIVVKPLDERVKFERDHRIVVVFNHRAYDKTFVLQTMVEKTIFSDYWLKYLDPRFDKRYKIHLRNPLKFYLLPSHFYSLIKNREVQIIRHIWVQKEERGEKLLLADNLYTATEASDLSLNSAESGTDHFHPDYKNMLGKTPSEGILKDLSLGGACVLLDEEPFERRGLILVHIETPSLTSGDDTIVTEALSLKVLGAIRGVSTINNKYGVHIAFLKRLNTPSLDSTFNKLERHLAHAKEPMSS